MYGVLEGQFRRYFEMAERAQGVTGETLLQLLERRLDNMVYRLGLRHLARRGAPARAARPLPGERPQGRTSRRTWCRRATSSASASAAARSRASRRRSSWPQRRGVPDWLEVSRETFAGRVKALPVRADLTMPINEKLIVELYSK